MTDYLASVHQAAKRFERLLRQGIARLDFQRFLEAAHGVAVHLLSEIRAAQVVMRKMARLVAARFRGALQPGYRFLEAAQLDQVSADVVVRIPKFRIDLDGALALHDGFFNAPLEMIGPAEKGVRLGGGMKLQ